MRPEDVADIACRLKAGESVKVGDTLVVPIDGDPSKLLVLRKGPEIDPNEPPYRLVKDVNSYVPVEHMPFPPEPSIVDQVAALDEAEGGPLRAKVETWKKGREEMKSFRPLNGVRTRYTKKIVAVNHGFFAKVKVEDL